MYEQDTFDVQAASEGMMTILRNESSQRLYADQDMAVRVIRAVTQYIGQEQIPSAIVGDGMESFIRSYMQEYEVLPRREFPAQPIRKKLRNVGDRIEQVETNFLGIKVPGLESFYYPRIWKKDLVFALEGKVSEESLMVKSEESDQLIIALFDAAYRHVGIRATVDVLARGLDMEYMRMIL